MLEKNNACRERSRQQQWQGEREGGLAGAYLEGLVPVMILTKGSGDECSKQAFVPWRNEKAWRTLFLCEIRMLRWLNSHCVCRFLVNCVMPSCNPKDQRWQLFFFLQTSDRTCSRLQLLPSFPRKYRHILPIYVNLPNDFETILTFQLIGCHFVTCILNRTNGSYHVFTTVMITNPDIFQRCKWQKRTWFVPFRSLRFSCSSSKPHECFQRKTWQKQFWTVGTAWLQVGFMNTTVERLFTIFCDKKRLPYSVHECSN